MKRLLLIAKTVILLFFVNFKIYSMNEQLKNQNQDQDQEDIEELIQQEKPIPVFQIQENHEDIQQDLDNQNIKQLMLAQLSLQQNFQTNEVLNLKNQQIDLKKITFDKYDLYEKKLETYDKTILKMEQQIKTLEKKVKSSFFLKVSDFIYIVVDYSWKHPIKVLFITGAMTFFVITIYDLYVGTLLMGELYYYLIGFMEKFFRAIKSLSPSWICPVNIQEAILDSSLAVKVTTADKLLCYVYKFINRFVG